MSDDIHTLQAQVTDLLAENERLKAELTELRAPHYQMAFKRVEELKSRVAVLTDALKEVCYSHRRHGNGVLSGELLRAESLLLTAQPEKPNQKGEPRP